MESILVSAMGVDGIHGSNVYPPRLYQAGYSRRGDNGLAATRPTDGTPGSDIRVRMAYFPEKPTVIQVAGEGAHSGGNWMLHPHNFLTLNAKGGDGGNGGRGQDGQQGGQGVKGRDATKYADAEPGGVGAQGGDAGSGTNGANGARAGNVHITVNEDDLDTLVGITWNVDGGKGGLSGTNGDPGDGGIGGYGGSGCSWEERHGDTVVHCSRPPAPAGPQGPPGNRPGTYLTGGTAGTNGSCHIRVTNRNGTESTYSDRYRLEVVGFDVLDENRDGINEPGENILVQNIRVRNCGSMPSPSQANPIKILIQQTSWLEPISNEPAWLPTSIPPGSTVEVPGTIRAHIRRETALRAPGVALVANDKVSLLASFERLHRCIPEFSGEANITIQYPLMLDAPTYLPAVAKGDILRFHWILRNISNAAYGSDFNPNRKVATYFMDHVGIFNFPNAADGSHEAFDELEELEPGAEVPIDQDFTVSERAEDYTKHSLRLELRVSDPDPSVNKQAVVMSYEIPLQVSGKYSYDPLSQYLFLVNSHTPLHAIHQVRRFIWSYLGLRVDTYNISLSGTLDDPDGCGKSILEKYRGKSVLIFGNSIPWFGATHKPEVDVWDLIDPWLMCTLAKDGMSILFLTPQNLPGLNSWAEMVTFPVQGESHVVGEQGSNISQIIDAVHRKQPQLGHAVHVVQGNTNSKSVAKNMRKRVPLRRYLTVSDANSTSLIEGLPKNANFAISTFGHSETEQISDYHAYMIIRALPFQSLVRMYWNMAAVGDLASVSHAVLYNGLQYHPVSLNNAAVNPNTFMIDQRYYKAVGWAIETMIGTEVARFCSRDRVGYGIPKEVILDQTPLLNCFLSNAPTSPVISTTEGHAYTFGVLGTVIGTTLPIGFRRFWTQSVPGINMCSRKAKLRMAVMQEVRTILQQACHEGVAPQALAAVTASSKKTKEDIKGAGGKKDLELVTRKRLQQLTKTNGADFTNLAIVRGRTAAVDIGRRNGLIQAQQAFLAEKQRSEGHSKSVIRGMVNPDNVTPEHQPASPAPLGGAIEMAATPAMPPSAAELEVKEALTNITVIPTQMPAPFPQAGGQMMASPLAQYAQPPQPINNLAPFNGQVQVMAQPPVQFLGQNQVQYHQQPLQFPQHQYQAQHMQQPVQ